MSSAEAPVQTPTKDSLPKTTRFGKKKQNRAKRCKSAGFTLEPDILAQEKSTEAVHFLLWIRNPTIHSLAKLRKCIKYNEREWMEDFLSFDGLGLLFQCLNNLANCESHHLGDMVLKMQCASCIREVVNSQSGLDCLLSMKDKSENLFGKRIAFALKTNNMMVKMQIFELLSALCLYSTDGYYLTLEALDRYKVWQKLPYRFSMMVKELKQADLTSFKIALMALINSIIVANENIHDRIRIRNEFISLNILDAIQGLRVIDDEDLNIQCDVFDEELSADADHLTELSSSSVDISKPQDLFKAIYNKIQDTPLESSLLGILYSLYQLDSNNAHCEATWINIERAVQHCAENAKKDTHYKRSNQTEVSNQQTQTDELELQPEERSSLRRKNCVIIKQKDSPHVTPVLAPPPPPPPPPAAPPLPGSAIPPPPPPPGPGAPPPPPGRGLTLPGAAAIVPPVEEIKTPEPQCKMKMLNWSKVPIQSLRKNSIWGDVAQMKDQINVKYNKLEELFSLRNSNTGEIPTSNEKALKRHSTSMEIALLEPKRSMIVNIFLKQFRHANASIIDLIRQCDSRTLGTEKIKGLLKILPTPEEVELISNFDGDVDKLGQAEKYYKDLIQVPHYNIRIEGMNLKSDFKSQMSVIRPHIQLLNSLCRQILNSDSLKLFLRFILHAGNFINKGSSSGSAYGFRINSLCKLAMVKSNVPRLSLMHHLVEEALLQNKHTLRFVDDLLEPLQKASKCTLSNSKAEFLQIRKNIDKFEHQMSSVEPGLKTHFSEFLEEAENDISDVEEGFERLDALSSRLRDHFCENIPFHLNDFLTSFLEFAEKVKLCEQEVEARTQQEKKALIRQKAMEELALKRKGGTLEQVVHHNPTKLPENRKIVDNIVNEIKKGKVLRRLSLKRKNRLAVQAIETSHL